MLISGHNSIILRTHNSVAGSCWQMLRKNIQAVEAGIHTLMFTSDGLGCVGGSNVDTGHEGKVSERLQQLKLL